MTAFCSCIIPAYNEAERIFEVLELLKKVDGIAEIIVVDDGSTDNTYKMISSCYKEIKVIRLNTNLGKSKAIREGLKAAHGKYILLIDADMSKLNSAEISLAIKSIKNDPRIDMLILKRIKDPFITRFVSSVIFSGERILKKKDLENILDKVNPQGYQLEVAINQYMIKNKKKVYWLPSSAINPHSIVKTGFYRGIISEIKKGMEIPKFIGPFNLIYQIVFFGKEKLPKR